MNMDGDCIVECRCMPPCDPYDICKSTRTEGPVNCHVKPYASPLKKSMSFLTTQELFSYKAIPAGAVICYIFMSVGHTARRETFEE